MNCRFFLLTLNVLCSVFLNAQDSIMDSSQSLIEIVMTTKQNLTNINTARTVESISIEKQKANGINTMQGLLNTASGVYMVDMGNEQHAMSIRLPMSYDPLYNYLENGIPLRPVGIFNNNELLELNRFSLQKIEVVKGPFSSGYGAQSIGASINFIQNSFAKSKNEISLQSNGYGQLEATAQAKSTIGKWKTLINFNQSQRNVDKDFHFNYSKQSFSVRLEKVVDANNELIFQSNIINYVGDQRDGYDATKFYNKNYSSQDRFSDRQTLAIRNSFQWKHKSKMGDAFNFTIFNRIIEEKQNPFYLVGYSIAPDSTASGQITKDKFRSLGVSIDHSKTNKNGKLTFSQSLYIDYTPDNRYTANYILVHKSNTNFNAVNLSYDKSDSLITNYKANLVNIAASVAMNYAATSKLKLYAGLRGDVLAYKFKNYLEIGANSGPISSDKSFSSINPEASVLYKINKNQSAFVQFGTGFTPPTLSKMYRGGSSTPQLDPAKYYNFEVGYKFVTQKFTAQISLYNMNGVDEFINVLTLAGTTFVNAGKTNHKGVELQLHYEVNNFEFNCNPSYAKHTFKEYSNVDYLGNVSKYDGNEINSAPNYLHYVNATYRFKQFHQLKLIAEWNKVGAYFIDPSNTTKYDGYDLFNIKSTINFNKFYFNVGINNLFDKMYATNADATYGLRYYPGLPRTLQIGLAYKF
jgi:iron complex outermembrane recepter protein